MCTDPLHQAGSRPFEPHGHKTLRRMWGVAEPMGESRRVAWHTEPALLARYPVAAVGCTGYHWNQLESTLKILDRTFLLFEGACRLKFYTFLMGSRCQQPGFFHVTHSGPGSLCQEAADASESDGNGSRERAGGNVPVKLRQNAVFW